MVVIPVREEEQLLQILYICLCLIYARDRPFIQFLYVLIFVHIVRL